MIKIHYAMDYLTELKAVVGDPLHLDEHVWPE